MTSSDLASVSRRKGPSQDQGTIDRTARRERVLNAIVSDEAMMRARIAALQSHMSFRSYLDFILRQARPIEVDNGDTAQADQDVDCT